LVGLYEPLNVRDISLGQGMELKVFWGRLYARDYRELHSDSLDPDGCLVQSSDFVTIKTTKSQVQNKGGRFIMGSTM
jgi:hypothetical protein